MKIQIDDTEKTIKIEGNVNLGEFIDKITKLLPEWKEYTLETNTIINNWSSPIIIRDYINTNPWRPIGINEPYRYYLTSQTGVASNGVTYSAPKLV